MTKKPTKNHVVMLEQAELVCILMEELSGDTRPAGMTAVEAVKAARIVGSDEAAAVEFTDALRRASDRIMRYVMGEIESKVPGVTTGFIGGDEGRMQ